MDPRIVDTYPVAEPAEKPVRYDTIQNYPTEMIATGTMPTRVPHDNPLVITTPLPAQTWFRRHEAFVIGMIAVVVFFAVWQGVGSARIVSRLFLPAPTDVIESFGEIVRDG